MSSTSQTRNTRARSNAPALSSVVETWLYPVGSRILEISTKCLPAEGFQAAAEFKNYLAGCRIVLTAKQQAKTKSALEFFGKRLAAEERTG